MNQDIKILFAGDFRALQPADVQWDSQIEGLLADNDLKVVNFEAPVSGGVKTN